MRKGLHNKQMTLLPDRRTLTLIFIVCAIFARVVCAQLPIPQPRGFQEIPITPEPVGSGARALGQSAFIAVADDATAASWNPAGLINVERPEASFVGAWRTTTKDYSPADPSQSIDQDRWSLAQINFLSYAQPIKIWSTDAIISVSYHQVYDLEMEYKSLFKLPFMPPFPPTEVEFKGKSEGAISAYSLAGGLSMPSHPEIAIGASFNWYAQSLFNDYAWQANATQSWWLVPRTTSPLSVIETTETFDDFRGHNFTFGLLWDAYERHGNMLTLGLVYHTPFTAKVDRASAFDIEGFQFSRDRIMHHIEFPASLGAGANYRISDSLSVAFDVEWKEWSKLKRKDRDGEWISPFDSDTVAYRLGCEYLLEHTIDLKSALRGGLFYEERPVANYTDPLPVYGLSAGLGWTAVDRYSLDFAYQYRWGEQDLGNIDLDYQEHLFVASLVIYF